MDRGHLLLSKLTPTAVIAALTLAVLALCSLLAPWLAPYGEGAILSNVSYAPADADYLIGGDVRGRDLYSRLFYGIRMTVVLSIVSAALCFVVGCAFGFLAALSSDWLDGLISRIADGFMAFPSIIFALIVVTMLGQSIAVVVFAAAFVNAVQVFRVARALGKDIVVQDYIEAARLRREHRLWIMWHEILPNAMPSLAAEFGIRVTFCILLISGLSFLGLGVQPPQADLGVMIRENMGGLVYGSFAPLFPAICIAALVLSINSLMDWYVAAAGVALPGEV